MITVTLQYNGMFTGISTRLPNPILPTFVKNDKISSYYFLFKKKILMMCTYFIESSNVSLMFMLVIIHRVYVLKLFLGIIHLDRNQSCLQD
jgi:hypothetical protein